MTAATGGPQIPGEVMESVRQNMDNLLNPEVLAQLAPEIRLALQGAVSDGTAMVFWCTLLSAFACLVCCLLLPREESQ